MTTPGFNSFFLLLCFISLCRRGVAIQPADKNTAHGYFILADIYAYLGEPAKSREYHRLGQRILASVRNVSR